MQLSLLQDLPGPESNFWDWQSQARCRGADPAVFFSSESEKCHTKRARERRAKELCRVCPVLAQCRAHALAVAEPFGVWGGLSEAERKDLIINQNRRPRSHYDRSMGGSVGQRARPGVVTASCSVAPT